MGQIIEKTSATKLYFVFPILRLTCHYKKREQSMKFPIQLEKFHLVDNYAPVPLSQFYLSILSFSWRIIQRNKLFLPVDERILKILRWAILKWKSYLTPAFQVIRKSFIYFRKLSSFSFTNFFFMLPDKHQKWIIIRQSKMLGRNFKEISCEIVTKIALRDNVASSAREE